MHPIKYRLEYEVRKACMVPLAANYGTKMPSNIEDITALVTTTTLDTSSLLLNHGETSSVSDWKSFAEEAYQIFLLGSSCGDDNVYGRTRSVNVHREDFTVKSKQPSPSSLPPPRFPYRNIWVTTITDNHGSKLIFGTKTFNSLVTSSIRIDSPYEPEVGPSTHHFTIFSNEQSRDVVFDKILQ
ncbi:hypothetical protein INT47_005548 [Mucor saturninus]|uniref:Uncharacterized protein n=1 Tax=Mucor saturninus TaxID=64648 RepID=A0A8H7V3X9_9FUNG|nr:hypothetical protein INT47_005548 [Mucor saturninus]